MYHYFYLLYPHTKLKSLSSHHIKKKNRLKKRVEEMKSIVFFLLSLLAVGTSENAINGWYNFTDVHEEEVIWESLAPMKKEHLTYKILQRQNTCGSSRNDPCTGVYNGKKYSTCPVYTRCKRLVSG